MFQPDLIIFDCDGTLVDSELLHNTATSQTLAEQGFPQYTPDYCLEHFVGAGQAKVWAIVQEENAVTLPADINDRYIQRVAELQADMARPVAGAADILRSLRGRIKICVGSNGEPLNVHGVMRSSGLIDFFDAQHIFTASDVAHPKPAPDLYLYAAEKMHSTPHQCLVIEDSVPGAQAGLSAGMDVIGYIGVAHNPDKRAADLRAIGVMHIIDDLRAILPLLKIAA